MVSGSHLCRLTSFLGVRQGLNDYFQNDDLQCKLFYFANIGPVPLSHLLLIMSLRAYLRDEHGVQWRP